MHAPSLPARAALFAAILATLACACAAAPPDAAVAPVECPPGSTRAEGRCVSTDVACPEGAQWDGQRCLAAAVAAEPPVPPVPPEQPSIAADYVGQIEINGGRTDVETHFDRADSVVRGRYEYGPSRSPGQLSSCRLSARRLTCAWTESALKGTFAVELAPDGQSFSGIWDFDDGRPGGAWNGRSRPPASVAASTPPPEPDSPRAPTTISGTYTGEIGVGGRSGPAVVELDASTGRVTGSYRYGTASGRLSECRLAARRLTCTWTEGALTGGFRVELAPDNRSFRGTWDFADGRPGGPWSGKR